MGIAEKFKSNAWTTSTGTDEVHRASRAHAQGHAVFLAQFKGSFGDAAQAISDIEQVGWQLQEFSSHNESVSAYGSNMGGKTVVVCLFRRV